MSILKRETNPTPDESLVEVGKALDEISWEWLCNLHSTLAEAVQEAAEGGLEPKAIRRFVMAHTQRYELALRCEQAARWVRGLAG